MNGVHNRRRRGDDDDPEEREQNPDRPAMLIHSVHAEEEQQGCSSAGCPPDGELGVLNLVVILHDAQLGNEDTHAVRQTACSGRSIKCLPWNEKPLLTARGSMQKLAGLVPSSERT